MINFEEELRRFQPILEIEQAESSIRNQDLDDMADVALGIIMEARDEASSGMRNLRQETYQNIVQEIEVENALL